MTQLPLFPPPKIVTVLSSGGGFGPKQVQGLARQAARHAPGTEFLCISDVDVPGVKTLPTITHWKGWWSKMEVFRPDIEGDILVMDLDTVIWGDITDMLLINKLTMLHRFGYGPKFPGQGDCSDALMYIPWEDRAEIWDHYSADPEGRKTEWADPDPESHKFYGTDDYLAHFWEDRTAFWQRELPGQVVRYGQQCNPRVLGGKPVPHNARIIVCDINCRPWNLPYFARLYR